MKEKGVEESRKVESFSSLPAGLVQTSHLSLASYHLDVSDLLDQVWSSLAMDNFHELKCTNTLFC